MKKYIVYKIINKINNNIYIGVHCTENLNDNYMGSGTNIKKAIKKFGLKNFEKIILYQFDTQKEMLDKEKELVNEEFISRPDTYNIIVGGGTFLTTDTLTVKDKNDNYFRVHKNDPRYLSGELKFMLCDQVIVKDNVGNKFSVNKNDPRYKSGELVGATKGMISVKDKNGNTCKIYKDDDRFLSGELAGVTKNMILVRDVDNNTLMIDCDDPRYISGELIPYFTGKKHTDETKKVIGSKNSIHQKGEKNSQYGTIWITNGIENKKIKKDEKIPNGWYKGRKIINKNKK